MIVGKNINKIYAADQILKDVAFKIGNNVKVGIVGRNGCGKSTLLKLLVNEEELTSGSIDIQNEVIGYIPQELVFPNEMVLEYLEKHVGSKSEIYKIDILVKQLEYTNYDPYQLIETLSEGQKMKLKLLSLLLSDPTTLLIDEPTNHLDIEGILWFEKYIKHLNKSVVMISHDRQFLNNTVDEIWEIEDAKITRFVGNFDYYKGEKLRLIDKWNEEYVRFLRRKEQLETLLERSRFMAVSRSGKGTQAVKKKIQREIDRNVQEKYVEHKIKPVSFDTDITSSKLMVRFDNVSKSYDNKSVFTDIGFEIRGGEKIWLYGQNGAGKTTIVKMIMQEEKPTSGEVRLGNNMRIGYFAQKQTHLDFDDRVQEYFMKQTGCEYSKSFSQLNSFLFDKNSIQKRIKELSPGERARFAFCIFAYNDYDMLVLDEPANHLDIETKEVIEESLSKYKGTLLLVSHDRFFVERVGVNRMLNLNDLSSTS